MEAQQYNNLPQQIFIQLSLVVAMHPHFNGRIVQYFIHGLLLQGELIPFYNIRRWRLAIRYVVF
jgi:hypothetical protein